MNYRLEIDGLRTRTNFTHYMRKLMFLTIRFLRVVSYQWIFFVILGYLITLIILKELTGTFSFKYFYERRIIFKYFRFVVCNVSVTSMAWIYMLLNSFIDFSKSILITWI